MQLFKGVGLQGRGLLPCRAGVPASAVGRVSSAPCKLVSPSEVCRPQSGNRPFLSQRTVHRAPLLVVRAAETEQESQVPVLEGDGWESFPPPNFEPTEQVLDLWQQADAVCFDGE